MPFVGLFVDSNSHALLSFFLKRYSTVLYVRTAVFFPTIVTVHPLREKEAHSEIRRDSIQCIGMSVRIHVTA